MGRYQESGCGSDAASPLATEGPTAVPADPPNERISAWIRLVVCALALLLVAGLGCRPRWSADGKRLVFHALQGQNYVYAEHDFATGKTRRFAGIGPRDGASDIVWDGAGRQWVIVEADAGNDNAINVYTRDRSGALGEAHSFEAPVRNISCVMHAPVVADGHVFISHNGIVRLDLNSGEDVKAGGRNETAFPFGAGVGYVKKSGADWEIGELHAKTLARTPWVTRPEGCAWDIQSHPRFTSGLDRCAVLATQGERSTKPDERQWAILVLKKGKLITAMELGKGLFAGPLAWIDDVTICATVVRPGKDSDTVALVEVGLDGKERRETTLLEVPVNKQMQKNAGVYQNQLPFLMQPSPSPDGRKVAFSTAHLGWLPADDAGLLVLHRGETPSVERLPFEFEDQ